MATVQHIPRRAGDEPAGEIKDGQVLGDRSPLQLDDDGRAEVPDDVVDLLTARHPQLMEVGGESATSGSTDEFDITGWLEQDYQTRTSRVEAGEVDSYLDMIIDAETSDTVIEAAETRLEE